MTNDTKIRALFGGDFKPRSEMGYWLARCRDTRALLDWITPGAYAWWIYFDELKAQQRKLLSFRRPTCT